MKNKIFFEQTIPCRKRQQNIDVCGNIWFSFALDRPPGLQFLKKVRWLSGRKRFFAKEVNLKRVPWVRIPLSPPFIPTIHGQPLGLAAYYLLPGEVFLEKMPHRQ